MITRRHVQIGIALSIASAASVVAYIATHRAPPPTVAGSAQKILYWYDPMRPEQHFDKPGKSPFMDMPLQPRYAQDVHDQQQRAAAAGNTMTIDARSLQQLGLRLATVRSEVLAMPITAVGSIVFNERDIANLQARSAGFVQRVYGLAVGDYVQRGAPIVDLLVPEWLAVQQEIIVLQNNGDSTLLAAARARALALGMSPSAIDALKTKQQAPAIFTLVAPQSGIIKTLDIRAGMSVVAGAPLATLNGNERVWLEMAVPQALAQSISIGTRIDARFDALPGFHQTGTVIAILPESDPGTRTLRVRAELTNTRGELRPGLLAQANFADHAATPTLTIPAAAVIRGGEHNRVIVANDDGGFTPVAVTIGRASGDTIEVLEGLTAGQRVVVSGQFLIDSEANLTGQLSRLESAAPSRANTESPR